MRKEKKRMHLTRRKFVSDPECETEKKVRVPGKVSDTARESCPPVHHVRSSSALHGPYHWHLIHAQLMTLVARVTVPNWQGALVRPRPRCTKSSARAPESPLGHPPSQSPDTNAPETDASVASHQRTMLASRNGRVLGRVH
jgi:hypothetical protein